MTSDGGNVFVTADLEDDQQRRWIAHCERMAEATYAVADWCEDVHMLAAYVALGARWIRMAEREPPSRTEASH